MGKLKQFLLSKTHVGTFLKTPLYVHGSTFAFILFILAAELFSSGFLQGLSLGLFIFGIAVCVTAHEYGHIYAAQKFGNYTREVVLLPIGGVATMLPAQTAKETILVSLAGPAVNFILVIPAIPLALLLKDTQYIAIPVTFMGINLALGIFNLIPAYPMDGGRIFQGIVWYFKDYHTATAWAIKLSKLFVPLFIIFGLFTNSIMLIVIAVIIWIYCTNNPEEGSVM